MAHFYVRYRTKNNVYDKINNKTIYGTENGDFGYSPTVTIKSNGRIPIVFVMCNANAVIIKAKTDIVTPTNLVFFENNEND